MRRIWRKIPPSYYVQNEFMLTRPITASSVSQTEQSDEPDPEKAKRADKTQPEAANKLLSTLTGFKVEKTLGSTVGRSPRLKSVAADFQELITKKTHAENVRPENVDTKIVESAKGVAKLFPTKEVPVVESDLLKQLRRHSEATAAGQQGDLQAVSSILSGIRVERQPTLQQEHNGQISHAERALAGRFDSEFNKLPENADGQRERPATHQQTRRTLFDRQRFNIFKSQQDGGPATVVADPDLPLSLWQREEDRELRALSYSAINNGFDEMIKWTEEGKMWQFPIDNEQGMEEEQAIPFHEHIFFDHLLVDFPDHEPIRNFMELVCIGLSQNPYLTVAQKHDHVRWFGEYFRQRDDVLKKALEADKDEEAAGRLATPQAHGGHAA